MLKVTEQEFEYKFPWLQSPWIFHCITELVVCPSVSVHTDGPFGIKHKINFHKSDRKQ